MYHWLRMTNLNKVNSQAPLIMIWYSIRQILWVLFYDLSLIVIAMCKVLMSTNENIHNVLTHIWLDYSSYELNFCPIRKRIMQTHAHTHSRSLRPERAPITIKTCTSHMCKFPKRRACALKFMHSRCTAAHHNQVSLHAHIQRKAHK